MASRSYAITINQSLRYMQQNLEGLDEFCTVRQLEVLEAVRLHGSNRKAAVALKCSHTMVDSVINALKKKAAIRGLSVNKEKQPIGSLVCDAIGCNSRMN